MNAGKILSIISTITGALDTILSDDAKGTRCKRYKIQEANAEVSFFFTDGRIMACNISDKPIYLSFPRINESEGCRLLLNPKYNTDVTEKFLNCTRNNGKTFELSYIEEMDAEENEQICMAYGEIDLDIEGSVYLGDNIWGEIVPGFFIVSMSLPYRLKEVYYAEIRVGGKVINTFQNIPVQSSVAYTQIALPINFDKSNISTNKINVDVTVSCGI